MTAPQSISDFGFCPDEQMNGSLYSGKVRNFGPLTPRSFENNDRFLSDPRSVLLKLGYTEYDPSTGRMPSGQLVPNEVTYRSLYTGLGDIYVYKLFSGDLVVVGCSREYFPDDELPVWRRKGRIVSLFGLEATVLHALQELEITAS